MISVAIAPPGLALVQRLEFLSTEGGFMQDLPVPSAQPNPAPESTANTVPSALEQAILAIVRAEIERHGLVSGSRLRNALPQQPRYAVSRTEAGVMGFAEVRSHLAAVEADSVAIGCDTELPPVPAPPAKVIPMAETLGNSAAA